MEDIIFSPMFSDAIGEIMNISLGSSATAASNMLDHRVDITTPTVQIINAEEFSLGRIEPAVGVEIKYVCGLEGSNIMMLKRGDVKAIVDILLGTETPDEEFELNDLAISAVCELMNQMMGSSSTALSEVGTFSGDPGPCGGNQFPPDHRRGSGQRIYEYYVRGAGQRVGGGLRTGIGRK